VQFRRGSVSIVPLLLAVVAGQEEEQRATRESKLNSPPAVAHPLNEAIEVETSQQQRYAQLRRGSFRVISVLLQQHVPGLPCARVCACVRACVRECARGCGGVCCMLSFGTGLYSPGIREPGKQAY
jgi:hypothetical protein